MQDKIIPSQKTRLKLLLSIGAIATAAWGLSFFGVAAEGQAVTYDQWYNTMVWLFGLYAASEVGSKHAHAVLNKNNG